LFIARYWILDTGYSILVSGCWILDARYWMLETGYWILKNKVYSLFNPASIRLRLRLQAMLSKLQASLSSYALTRRPDKTPWQGKRVSRIEYPASSIEYPESSIQHLNAYDKISCAFSTSRLICFDSSLIFANFFSSLIREMKLTRIFWPYMFSSKSKI